MAGALLCSGMACIFISYRRDDSSGFAGRLEDDLSERFGDAQVFRDREIPAGADFANHLNDRLDDAEVVLVVIGRKWLDATDREGLRRLDQSSDWVRREIEKALKLDRIVIPVLVDGATMPWPDQLPDSLDALAGRQAVSLSDLRWKQDVDALAEQLAQRSPALAKARRDRAPAAESVTDLVRERLGEAWQARTPHRNGFGMMLGRWAAGRLGKAFSVFVTLVVGYLLVRALGGAQINRMLDKVIATTLEQIKAVL